MNENYILLEKDIEGNLFKIGQASSIEEINNVKSKLMIDREDVILIVAKVLDETKL